MNKVKYDDSSYRELWLLDRWQYFAHGGVIFISLYECHVGRLKKVETTWLYEYTVDHILSLIEKLAKVEIVRKYVLFFIKDFLEYFAL